LVIKVLNIIVARCNREVYASVVDVMPMR